MNTLVQVRRKRIRISGRAIYLGIVIVLCLLPLVWTVLASFGLRPDNNFSPPIWTLPPTLDQYREVGVAEPQFVAELLTSASVSGLTTILAVMVAFFAAYSLARSQFRGRNTVVQCFLILASLPVISYIIPLRDTLDTLHLTDTFIGTVLTETALYAPLAGYVLFGYLNQLSLELEEAARLDGANFLRILWGVVLPVSASGVAATAIIVFVLSWNQLLMPLVLTVRVRTIPVAMMDFFTFERELEWPTAAAALVVSILPIAIFVGLAHRLLEQFNFQVSGHAD